MMALRTRDPRGARDALAGVDGVVSASLFGDSVHALLASDATDAWRDALRDADVELLEASSVEPSLEDVFIHRVGRS